MKSSPEFCCHPVIRVPIIAGLECQGHSPPTCQVSDALLMPVKMTNSEFGNFLFSSSTNFLFRVFLVSLRNHSLGWKTFIQLLKLNMIIYLPRKAEQHNS